MRRLRRPRYTPPTLTDSGPGGRRRLADREGYEQTATFPTSFPGYWANDDVKGLLYSIQRKVCAYCSVETSGLEVEHFRPKGAVAGDPAHGGYWWLAYESCNYFLSCNACNGRKRTSFPLVSGSNRCTYDTRERITEEKRILLDPAEDPVEDWLTIEPSDPTARLIPDPELNASEMARVQEAIDLLGLNLNPVARKQRSNAYEEAARAAANKHWGDLRRRAMRHRPHSLAARIVVQRVAPQLMPSAEEEMTDLLDSLWEDLRELLRDIRSVQERGRRITNADQRQLDALAWAIIILRTDPPARDSAFADAHLAQLFEGEERGIRNEILSLFRALVQEAL